MNSANLQLEGLYLALAALHETLIRKGVLTREDLGASLRRAEALATGDDRATEDLRPAERDAVAFAPRLLLEALEAYATGGTPDFSALARRVGSTKRHQGTLL
jgi:hypothetical protein